MFFPSLVNNAAFGWMGPLEEMTMTHMRNMSETNIVGTFRMTQEVLPPMKQHKSGRIVNISSLAGINGKIFMRIYGYDEGRVLPTPHPFKYATFI